MRRIFEAAEAPESRFFSGGAREVTELLGGTLPELPAGPLGGADGDAFLVELMPQLRQRMRTLIEFVYQGFLAAEESRAGRYQAERAATPLDQVEQLLEQLLTAILEQERRLGLMNLFWLAHSLDVAELLAEFFSRPNVKLALKYQLHPFLQGVHRSAFSRFSARFRHGRESLLRRHLGAGWSSALVDTIVDDQLSFTECEIGRMNLAQVLGGTNKRFRLTFPQFRAIQSLCRERMREGLRRREPRFLEALRRAFPGQRVEEVGEERTLTRACFHPVMLTFVLAEVARPAPSVDHPVLQVERGCGRGWGELVADYLDLTQAVRRSEVVDLARRTVRLVGQREGERDLRRVYESGRLFRFNLESEIWKLVRTVTVIFADLRGFTATSEGAISERELAHHLYEVFDPISGLVAEHRGRIDKFTGDGVMITFGFARETETDELNALRTALAIQAHMAGLRAAGRTAFSMGISIHTGRAQVTHFIVDDWHMDRTVIGRNVNIAGRLSGSGKTQATAFDDAHPEGSATEPVPEPVRDVWVDADGTLYNVGIVVSQDTVEALVGRGAAVPYARQEARGYCVSDSKTGKNLLLEYVGDAKFKGVGRSLGIYCLTVERAVPGASSGPEPTP
jgi:class 3 adenylate cyclase